MRVAKQRGITHVNEQVVQLMHEAMEVSMDMCMCMYWHVIAVDVHMTMLM